MYHDLREAFSDVLFQLVNPCFITPLYFEHWLYYCRHHNVLQSFIMSAILINCEIPKMLWNIYLHQLSYCQVHIGASVSAEWMNVYMHRLTQFSSVQSLSRVRLFANPWITARQASLSITNSRSPLKPMSIKSVMHSSHLILCHPLLRLPPIPPSIRVFSNESALPMRWPKYWSFSFSTSPSNEHPGWSPLGWTGWISLQSKGLLRVFSNTTVQKYQFFSAQFSSQSNYHIHTWPLEKP